MQETWGYQLPTAGATTSSDEIITAETLRQLIFLKAEQMLYGSRIMNTRSIPGLEYRFTIPDQTYVEPTEVTEGTVGDYQTITWFDVEGTLRKFQLPLFMKDEVFIRQLGNLQYEYSIRAAAQGLAQARDSNMFEKIKAGVGATVPAQGHWKNETKGNPVKDVAEVIGQILMNTEAMPEETRDIKILYPVELLGYMKTPIQVREVYESVDNFIKREFQIELIPTRKHIGKDAYVILKSDMTALHLVHDGSKFYPVEQKREMGVGQKYMFTQFYDTVVMPYKRGTTGSRFIYKITDVLA